MGYTSATSSSNGNYAAPKGWLSQVSPFSASTHSRPTIPLCSLVENLQFFIIRKLKG